jgi:hypothetical protein
LASVSVDDVRDVVNVSSAEVPDVKVLKMVKRAEVTLELETRWLSLIPTIGSVVLLRRGF